MARTETMAAAAPRRGSAWMAAQACLMSVARLTVKEPIEVGQVNPWNTKP